MIKLNECSKSCRLSAFIGGIIKGNRKKNEFIVSFLNEDVTANYLFFLKIQENRAVSKDENDKLTIYIISFEIYSSCTKNLF